MKPALDTALFEAEVGDILKPLRTPEGFHLIRVEEKVPPRNLDLEEVRPRILDYFTTQAKQANYLAYIKKLTDKAEIVVEGAVTAENSALEGETEIEDPAGG
jgi:peptidyl-prolyl cis-trans isomerase C